MKPDTVDDIYPLVILVNRYGGGEAYGGNAKYVALNLYPTSDVISHEINSGDIEAAEFWEKYDRGAHPNKLLRVGRGDTPNAALYSLFVEMRNNPIEY